jgi:hypothetical protein
MKITIAAAIISTGLIVSALCNAQAPTGSTGECKDGTYTSAASKSGACSGHGGVKEWHGSAASTKASATPMAPKAAAPATTAAPATPAPPTTSAPATKTATAAGGGPGQVWVNTKSKVYHCPGTKWYGKTKQGEYMTESAAKGAGDRPDHGKACS